MLKSSTRRTPRMLTKVNILAGAVLWITVVNNVPMDFKNFVED